MRSEARPSPPSGTSRPPGGSRQLARVRRNPDRARYDSAAVHGVLDAVPFCHVATVRRGRPVVLPMVHARLGDTLVLHGSPAAGLFRDLRGGSPVCVTATMLDGLVLARSARNHSVNYRSVTVHGHAVAVTETGEATAAMRALIEHLTPGRWDQLRPLASDDIRETGLWRVTIEEASVKARRGSTIDPPSDAGLPVWAGHIPARLVFGQPVPAPDLPSGVGPVRADSVVNPAFSSPPQ